MNNPLLANFNQPFESTPFDTIKPEHFLPAIQESIQEAKAEIEAIKREPQPTFQNTIEALDQAGNKLGIVAGIFFNLNAAETNEQIQKLAREISPLITQHGNDVLLDKTLFSKVRQVHEQKKSFSLTEEQQTLLDKTYKSFLRNGANLQEDQAKKLREIDQELAQLSLKFGENVLAETNRYQYFVADESELDGLPASEKEAAAQVAEEQGKPGQWAFTLHYPSFIPAMTYLKNRDIRQKLFLAYNSKSCKGDELDNQETILSLLTLRHKRANLLGYTSHAAFILEERMAKSPEKVLDFLDGLLEKAKPKAEEDVREIEDFARQLDGLDRLQRWDFAYYSELLKKKRFELDDELLRPYFQLEKVVEGVFITAKKLFGLTFEANPSIPVYHQEVTAYEVKDRNGKHVALFYADFFPRSGKRGGAWMTSYKSQYKQEGKNHRPHVSIVCNFSKPTKTKPSLLTFNEVTTLFHEFGHALHGMLAQSTYQTLSGTSVYWDFVELPSQIFENWCYEKECLDLFAQHYETGEKLPQVYIDRIKKASNFLQGYQTLRQISFGLLDMAYHMGDPAAIQSIPAFEQEILKKTTLLPVVPGTLMSTAFSHIFQGGYAAGYYSYKWAEVLDADAFDLFLEKGVFDQETAQSFQEHILSAGGEAHPSLLYRRFRGRDPKPEALLRRAGLLPSQLTSS